jgi:protein-arginine kinase activator protein McsA
LKEILKMVCEKCTKKLSKLATVNVDRNKASSSRVTNENKLLSSKQKFKATTGNFRKCRLCKMMTHHVAAHYCKSCRLWLIHS